MTGLPKLTQEEIKQRILNYLDSKGKPCSFKEIAWSVGVDLGLKSFSKLASFLVHLEPFFSELRHKDREVEFFVLGDGSSGLRRLTKEEREDINRDNLYLDMIERIKKLLGRHGIEFQPKPEKAAGHIVGMGFHIQSLEKLEEFANLLEMRLK